MKLCYQSLFTVSLRHSFYREGRSLADFNIRPTADTAQLLEQRGLIFRAQGDRFGIYAEIIPGSSPAELRRGIGSENLALRFLLLPQHSYLFNISDLEHYRLGRELFCFDNLRDDQADSRFYLGDSVAGARLGDPVALQTGRVLDYDFTAPVSSAQLDLFDRFGNQLDSHAVTVPAGEPAIGRYRYDLGEIDGLKPGRYRLQDDHGGALAFYYDPAQFGEKVFGIVELFNRTDQLTPDNSNQVPAAYRYLDGDELTGFAGYTLQMERRSTRWRYIVTKKYDNNAITLAQLAVTGPVSFDRADEATRVVFTAHDPLPLAESQQSITLAHDGTELRSLPNPSLSSPVEGSAAEGIKYSDIYVYV